jgi:copper chaperone CopZ
MKTIPILILLAAALWLGSVALRASDREYSPEVAEVPHALGGEAPAGFVDLDVSIEGMCGPCCERTLFDKVRVLDGVASVAVSFDEESVLVRLADDRDPQVVLDALTTDKHTPSLEL